MEVYLVELLDYEIKHVSAFHPGELFLEFELLENLFHVVGKTADEVPEVLRHVALVVQELVEIVGRNVVEPGSGDILEYHAHVGNLAVVLVERGKYFLLGVGKDAVEAFQERER